MFCFCLYLFCVKIIYMKYIITCNKQSSADCLSMLKKHKDIKFLEWLDAEVGLVEYSGKLPLYTQILVTDFYIRHIFSVTEIADFEHSEQVLRFFAYQNIDKTKSFSFQVRKTKRVVFDNEIIFAIAKELEQDGYVLDVKDPEQIVSVFISEQKVYLGVGNKIENLSKFKGGMYHFRDDESFVSRAEYKLLEAYDCFNLDWTNKTNGIDLGAAPGGWSKVLADHCKTVYAVDPANLDEKIKNLDNVSHYKMTSQEFAFKHKDSNLKFDILVNDMKMDATESIEITKSMAQFLNADADIVLTLKLPHNCQPSKINSYISNISKCYKVMAARQLFHNRSEITVWAKNY